METDILEPKDEDRISLLPEEILCFLSQKRAIKTCVLSKAWRYLGCTRPKIEYSGEDDSVDSPEFMDRILQGYHHRNLRLDKFTLWLSEGYVDRVDTASLLNKWIPIIIHNMRVTTFHLSMNSRPQLFELPSLILESDNIQNLYLVRCMLNSSTCVDLKLLHTLNLFHVCIPEQVLDNILSNCPLITNVSLLYCKGFTRIKLLKKNTTYKPMNLNYFSFRDSDSKPDISIEFGERIQALKTVQIDRCLLSVSSRNKPLEFALLTRLILRRVQLPSDLFLSNLHCLEVMKLDRCSGIKEFKLSSRSMKRLRIHNICRPFKATIDALRIVSFNYKGILPQSISFATTPSDDLWKSKITLRFHILPQHCFDELYGLLKVLSQSEISLELDRIEIRRLWSQDVFGEAYDGPIDRIVIVSEEVKQLPVAVEHLTINRSRRNYIPSPADYFLNRLFHEFRPSYMYMGKGMLTDTHNEHLEIAEILFKHRGTIWQPDLEGVDLQVLYRNQSEWQPVEHTSFTELSKNAADSKELQLRFHFKWRD